MHTMTLEKKGKSAKEKVGEYGYDHAGKEREKCEGKSRISCNMEKSAKEKVGREYVYYG